ncbi:winged helix-turn-helix transcriptional regulator [Kitasatospora kifunensis]|uniref:DNA-binding HxlR family transcriptional regulator n=1 Tax=Kitasatospora kifunensis TaxID=58351 RepID=A0A7W7VZG4_KITKI|nr:helix-turn-helix domain-containing protein [Kitasatospora kifunensis]MBB4928531.1 DNA-binding HxlR family transcriptional regulator [Kitasatospora kifunensis]
MATNCLTGQHTHHDVYAAQCPCRAMLDLLANKWSALAIGALEEGPLRFGALQRLLQGVSPKVLTQTLRRLEDAGLVDRTVYPAVPLHVEYALTDLGLSAAVPLRLLRTWVEENIDDVTSVPSHRETEPSTAK